MRYPNFELELYLAEREFSGPINLCASDLEAQAMEKIGFSVYTATSPAEVAKRCNLLVTTTASTAPLLYAKDIRPGTHITAMGADAPGKQELDPEILRLSNIVAADSVDQCLDHGELAHAYRAGLVLKEKIVELGTLVAKPKEGRQSENQITLADLTGVGVQDLQIAKAVLEEMK